MTPAPVQPINLTEAIARSALGGELRELRRLPSVRVEKIREGALLWVREPFRMAEEHDGFSPSQAISITGDLTVQYAADRGPKQDGFGRLRFAREMPRAISRAVLRVVAIRREPIQDIGDYHVEAEGFASRRDFARAWNASVSQWQAPGARQRWEDNPEVIVVTFRALRINIDALLDGQPAEMVAA